MIEERRRDFGARRKWKDLTDEERRERRRQTIGKSEAIGLAKGSIMAAREIRRGQTIEEIGVRFRRPADRRLFVGRYLADAAEWRRFAAQEAIRP